MKISPEFFTIYISLYGFYPINQCIQNSNLCKSTLKHKGFDCNAQSQYSNSNRKRKSQRIIMVAYSSVLNYSNYSIKSSSILSVHIKEKSLVKRFTSNKSCKGSNCSLKKRTSNILAKLIHWEFEFSQQIYFGFRISKSHTKKTLRIVNTRL